jgi:hypothetical protein
VDKFWCHCRFVCEYAFFAEFHSNRSHSFAGTDMAAAFCEYLVGKDLTMAIRAMVELSVRGQDDDEWAAYYGDT